MEQWRVEPMLDFRRIEMSDFPALRKMYEKYGNWSCDCTICGTYMWRDYLDIRISLEEEKLIVYQQLDGKHLFYICLLYTSQQLRQMEKPIRLTTIILMLSFLLAIV